MWTSTPKTTQRRNFRPGGDRLEAREVLSTLPLLAHTTRVFATFPGQVQPAPAFTGGALGSVAFNGGGGSAGSSIPSSATSRVLTAITPSASSATNFNLFGTGSRIGNPFVSTPSNVNLNILTNGGLLAGTSAGLVGGAVAPALTSGFGALSGLAFNNGLGGTPFSTGGNVGFNNNLFGSGFGATSGLAFNAGLGGTGSGSFLSNSGLVFNNGIGGTGNTQIPNGIGATTGLAFNTGVRGLGTFTGVNGVGVSNGLTFTGGTGFNNRLNSPFTGLNTSLLGVGRSFASNLSSGFGTAAGTGVNILMGSGNGVTTF